MLFGLGFWATHQAHTSGLLLLSETAAFWAAATFGRVWATHQAQTSDLLPLIATHRFDAWCMGCLAHSTLGRGALSGPLIMSDQTHRFNSPRGALASLRGKLQLDPLISSSITKTSNFPSKITLLPPNDQNYSNAPEFYKYLKILN